MLKTLALLLVSVSSDYIPTNIHIPPVEVIDCVYDGTDKEGLSGSWIGYWKNLGIALKHSIEIDFCINNHLILAGEGYND